MNCSSVAEKPCHQSGHWRMATRVEADRKSTVTEITHFTKSRKASQNTQHFEPWGNWARAAKEYIGFHFWMIKMTGECILKCKEIESLAVTPIVVEVNQAWLMSDSSWVKSFQNRKTL